MASPKLTLHLRSEDKKLEHRSALTPTTVEKLLATGGFNINVERSPVRIFDDAEFEKAGATLVPTGSWPDAPAQDIIIGLKELPEKDFPLKHTHIQFAHCYKGQAGWKEVLGRFHRGSGMLYDMEFLEKDKRRIAAFGYYAGYAGAALALMDWAWSLEHSGKDPMPGKSHYAYKADLDHEVKADLAKGKALNGGKCPTILIMGAKGRCGGGAKDLCKEVGIPNSSLVEWDLLETKDRPGPYPEIRDADIFVNCIYLSAKINPFVSEEFLREGKRNLSVVCDVSCDTTNPHNPIPFCNKPTYFNSPTISMPFSDPPLSYITIDHLPSLLPREASEDFSEHLLDSLKELHDRSTAPVWVGAEDLFKRKVKEMEQA